MLMTTFFYLFIFFTVVSETVFMMPKVKPPIQTYFIINLLK